ncbi:unnamed protein product, partial [Amoebophrya sp. A120]|eukprot:GSA120T00004799001.1
MRERVLRALKKRDKETPIAEKVEHSISVAAGALPQCLDDVEGVGTFPVSFVEFLRVFDRSIGDGDYFFEDQVDVQTGTGREKEESSSTTGGSILYLMDRLQIGKSPAG